ATMSRLEPRVGNETAQFLQNDCSLRSGVTIGRARATVRADAPHWHPPGHNSGRCRISGLVGAFLQALALSGWTIGRNVRIDTRWATANAVEIRRHAAELVALAPDVILAHGASTVGPLLQASRTAPIVSPVF